MEEGEYTTSMPSRDTPPSQNLDVLTNPEILRTPSCRGFYVDFFAWACLSKSLVTGDEIQSPAPFLSLKVGR